MPEECALTELTEAMMLEQARLIEMAAAEIARLRQRIDHLDIVVARLEERPFVNES